MVFTKPLEPLGSTGPEPPLGFCGPKELGELANRHFEWQQSHPFASDYKLAISPDNVIRVVENTYYASLLAEEGRSYQTEVIAASADSSCLPCRVIGAFETPIALAGPGVIKKLAPIFGHDSGLWVAEDQEGQLVCKGVVELAGLAFEPGLSPWVLCGGEPAEAMTLRISTVGAGWLELSVGLFGGQYQLRAGTIRKSRSFVFVPLVLKLLLGIEESLQQRYAAPLHRFVHNLIGYVLGLMRLRRCGGTLVVIPSHEDGADIRSEFGFEDGHAVKLDLGSHVCAFRETCHRTDGPSDQENLWPVRRRAMLTTARAIADATCADGCVVMDTNLRVRLIGTKISQQDTAKLPLVDYYSKEDISEALKSLGTRNKSACGFCQRHRGAVAFVVSQDGDLRVYCSDEQHAYAFDGVDDSLSPGDA